MKSSSLLLAGLCAAGLASGIAAKRFTFRDPSTPLVEGSASDVGPAGAIRSGRTRDSKPVAIPHVRSTATVESLLAAEPAGLYSSLSAWLTDASESDIAAFWDGYKQKSGRSNDIVDVVFLNWARLNPQGAIDANAGGKDEHYAWWAWAAHDPKGAMAKALATNADRVNNVAWGIGEFHPEWLREHYKELSDGARGNAFQGMMKWEDHQDPLASLEFMKEVGYGADSGTLKALARLDPWAALDWLKKNPESRGGFRGFVADPMALVIQTMAEERPEDLERLVKQTPSGLMKVKMESALFASLAKSDPAAALEQAQATTAPLIAAERYATLAADVMKRDPDRAFELAAALLKACPDAMSPMTMVEYPNGSSGSGAEIAGVGELFGSLTSKDPGRVLEMTATLPESRFGNSAFNQVSSSWAAQDLTAFTGWVDQQTDPKLRAQGENVVFGQLVNEGRFVEAIELKTSGQNEGWRVDSILSQWNRSEPDRAAEWLENSDLPAERKKALSSMLLMNQRSDD